MGDLEWAFESLHRVWLKAHFKDRSWFDQGHMLHVFLYYFVFLQIVLIIVCVKNALHQKVRNQGFTSTRKF